MPDRRTDLDRLYDRFAALRDRLGGYQRLADCTGYMDWPERGVYFFFSPDETRADSDQRRLTRVGTHAVSAGSGTTMWQRLRAHRGATSGTYAGGGNHRGSVFRERVGEAIIARENLHDTYPEWGEGSSAARDQRLAELELEQRVSDYIRELPFLWVAVDDPPGPDSDRVTIEAHTIALASNLDREPIDPRADAWLGHHSPSRTIRQAGLWNIDHADAAYGPAVLNLLDAQIGETEPL